MTPAEEMATKVARSKAEATRRHARNARVRKLLNLAGGDPATTDPEKRAAHAKAEQLAGDTQLAWRDPGAVDRIRSIADAFAFMNLRRPEA